MFGAWRCRLVGARPFSIHGDSYFELHLEREGSVFAVRTSAHTLAPEITQTPCEVEVTFLMSQVTGVKLVTN